MSARREGIRSACNWQVKSSATHTYVNEHVSTVTAKSGLSLFRVRTSDTIRATGRILAVSHGVLRCLVESTDLRSSKAPWSGGIGSGLRGIDKLHRLLRGPWVPRVSNVQIWQVGPSRFGVATHIEKLAHSLPIVSRVAMFLPPLYRQCSCVFDQPARERTPPKLGVFSGKT